MFAETVINRIYPFQIVAGRSALDKIGELNSFLAQVERRALRIAELAVCQRAEALDLVQDSMLKLAEKYAHKPADQWPPLFYRILQSRIRDWYRRGRVQRKHFALTPVHDPDNADDPLQSAADAGPDPARHLELEQIIPALYLALQRLPLRQQQVFLLRAWEGLDVQQTATAMNCGTGSVKTHYHRALQSLRHQLRDFRED
ncbi:MAG TPA: RNA polymerase sigma factor [Gammaproteobacteria bacterium]